jgi:hypothetical protein
MLEIHKIFKYQAQAPELLPSPIIKEKKLFQTFIAHFQGQTFQNFFSQFKYKNIKARVFILAKAFAAQSYIC